MHGVANIACAPSTRPCLSTYFFRCTPMSRIRNVGRTITIVWCHLSTRCVNRSRSVSLGVPWSTHHCTNALSRACSSFSPTLETGQPISCNLCWGVSHGVRGSTPKIAFANQDARNSKTCALWSALPSCSTSSSVMCAQLGHALIVSKNTSLKCNAS